MTAVSELFLTVGAVFALRMQSVRVQQLLLWLPGSKQMSNTPLYWRESSHWKENKLDFWSKRQTHLRKTPDIILI